jgi:hypothetical protein
MRQMTRNSWFPAAAFFLAVVLSVTGSVPRDAAAGILPLLVPPPAVSRLVAPAAGEAGDGEPCPDRETHASWRSRAILLLLIIVIIAVLVYRYFTGWKPMISGSSSTFPFVT